MLAVVALAILSASTMLIWGGEPTSGSVAIETLRTAVPSTTGEAPAPVSEMTDVGEEEALIAAAASAASETSTTTTPPSTSTTAAPSTTTTAANPTTTATSAAATTTQAPSPSSSSPPATSTPSTSASGYDSGAESDFTARIASYRSANGQAALTRDGALDSYARSWAKTMAERGQISHSDVGSLAPPWTAVGENVGMGGAVGTIFDALASSSGHQANMLGDFTHLGVGVYRASDGLLWTAHVFAR